MVQYRTVHEYMRQDANPYFVPGAEYIWMVLCCSVTAQYGSVSISVSWAVSKRIEEGRVRSLIQEDILASAIVSLEYSLF